MKVDDDEDVAPCFGLEIARISVGLKLS